MIRRAELNDIPPLMIIARDIFKEDPYPELRIDNDKMRRCFEDSIVLKDRHYFMVSVEDGHVNGAILGVSSPMIFYERQQLSIIMWYVKKGGDGMKLLDGLMEWVKTRPAIRVIDWTSERKADGRQARVLAKKYGYRTDVDMLYWLKPAVRGGK